MNSLEEQEKKRTQLRQLILKLASSSSILEDEKFCREIYAELEGIYNTTDNGVPFRHFYSDIFPVLTALDSNFHEYGDIDTLCDNLNILRKNYHKTSDIDISNNLDKLYDHVNLEVARITYTKSIYNNKTGKEEYNNLKSDITTLRKKANDIEQAQKKIKTKIKNQQKEHLTILSIFSAIVLTFISGIVFTSSVLNNISESSIYRTIIISLIIGLVVLNCIYGLFYFINQIIDKENDLKVFGWANGIILALIALTIIAWSACAVENRNNDIPINPSSQSTQFFDIND